MVCVEAINDQSSGNKMPEYQAIKDVILPEELPGKKRPKEVKKMLLVSFR